MRNIRDEYRELKLKLETKYKMIKHPKADRLFEIAWHIGHSNGLSEVRLYYEDLLELVK